MTWLVSLFIAGGAAAQTGPQITPADIARAKRLQPTIMEEDIARAVRANPVPQDRGSSGAVPAVPRIDALPRPLATAPVDLGAVAKGYEAAVGAPQGLQVNGGDQLLVFVTFAMPEASLKKLARQASAAKATMVLRGLESGSLVKTVVHAHRIMETRQVALQIDPQAFSRFGVRQTPTFVMVRAGAASQQCDAGVCFAPDAYVRVAGDVSIDYALRTIAARAPRFAQAARRLLANMEQ